MRFPRWIAALALMTATSVALAQQPAKPGETHPAGTQPTATQPGTTPPSATQPGQPAQPGMSQPTTAQTTTPPTEAPPKEALALPKAADALRDKGVPEGEVKKALEAARDEKLSAAEAGMLFTDLAKMPLPSDREQVDRFGKVVEEQLEKGLRGASLVQAIQTDLSTPEKKEGLGEELRRDEKDLKQDVRGEKHDTTPGATPPAKP